MKTTALFRSLPLFLLFLISWLKVSALDCGVNYAVYKTGDKPYVEISLEIAGASVTFKQADTTHLQASVDILLLLKSGDMVINYEKYVLNSPLVDRPQSLLDVKRMSAPNGEYTLEVTFQDLNDPLNRKVFSIPVSVKMDDALYLSELELLRNFKKDAGEGPFNKNGYFLEPLPFSFYDRGANRLAFYAEIYNMDKLVPADKTYLIRYFVEQDKGSGQMTLASMGNQRKKPAAIDAILVQMDISTLESGNYSLKVEIRNHNNELLTTRQLFFQRSNPFLNIDPKDINEEVLAKQFVSNLDEPALRYCLRAMVPLQVGADVESITTILKEGSITQMRYFVFRYFANLNPTDPELAYKEYVALANAVDKKFYTAYGYGFESDRGRIFMKYGRPDDLVHVEDEPSAPPYEIWVYYNFPKTKQQNVKFLFYNPSLAGEDFVLLHSNARGEVNNPRWERTLYKRNAPNEQDGDDYEGSTTMKRNVNRNARVYFEDF